MGTYNVPQDMDANAQGSRYMYMYMYTQCTLNSLIIWCTGAYPGVGACPGHYDMMNVPVP